MPSQYYNGTLITEESEEKGGKITVEERREKSLNGGVLSHFVHYCATFSMNSLPRWSDRLDMSKYIREAKIKGVPEPQASTYSLLFNCARQCLVKCKQSAH